MLALRSSGLLNRRTIPRAPVLGQARFSSPAEDSSGEAEKRKAKWIPSHTQPFSPAYHKRPTVEQLRSKYIKLTPFKTQFEVNRLIYNEQVSVLRKQYREEHLLRQKQLAEKDHKKISEKMREAQLKLNEKLKKAQVQLIDWELADDPAQDEIRVQQRKAASTRRREATQKKRLELENLQQRLLLVERQKQWIENPEDITEDVFSDTRTTTLKGFWPLPHPEEPSGFAGPRVNAHLHWGDPIPLDQMEEGESISIAKLWKQHDRTLRGDPPAKYNRQVYGTEPTPEEADERAASNLDF